MTTQKIETKTKNKISAYNKMPNKKLRPINKLTKTARGKIMSLYGDVSEDRIKEYIGHFNEYVAKNNKAVDNEQRLARNAKAREKRKKEAEKPIMVNITFSVDLRRVNGADTFSSSLTETIVTTKGTKAEDIRNAKEEFYVDIMNRYGDGIQPVSIKSVKSKTIIDISPSIPDRKQAMEDIVPLDGYGNQEWNKKKKSCVLDYLRWKYDNTQGFTNKNGKFWLSDDAFVLLSKLLYEMNNADDDEHIIQRTLENKSLTNEEHRELMTYIEEVKESAGDTPPEGGVLSITMEHLYLWCVVNNIPHYALDTNEHLVFGLKYVRNKNTKKGKGIAPLVYQMKNNHFNPVIDPDYILSISQWGNNQPTQIVSENIAITEKEKEKPKYETIEVTDLINTLPDIISEHNRDLQNRNIRLKETIKNCLEVSSIYLKEKEIKYVNINEEELAYKNYCSEHKLDYKHQSLSTLGLNMIGEIQKSHMNPLVFNTFNTYGISHRIHHGQTPEFTNRKLKDAQAFDINKHYSACLLQLGEVGVIQFQDDFTKYNNSDITIGYYYVETVDMKLLHGSNIYSHRIVALALKDKLITKENIKYMLKCNHKIPAFRFKQFVEDVYNTYGTDLGKKIINRSVGCMNNTTANKYNGVGLTNSTDELMSRIKLNEKPFVQDMKINDVTYWLYGSRKSVMCPSNNRPLWNTILDESNIILYETAKKIGGTVLFRKTDCLVIYKPLNIAPTDEIGGYKVEAVPKNTDLVENVRHMEYKEPRKVNLLPYNTSDSLPEIIEHCKEKGLLISGRGGTGKTYCALSLIKELNINVRLAFTNKATINIRGSTIDNYLKLDKEGKICSHWAHKLTAKYVIVDEISMLSARYWSLLCDLKKITGATFILLGDYRQCQPIEATDTYNQTTTTDFHYQSAINYLTNYNRVDFNVFNPKARYDKQLWDISEQVFNGKLDNTKELEIPFKDCDLINGTNICYLNDTRKSINKIVNEKLKPTNAVFLKCPDTNGYEQDAYIYEGLKVILSKTIKVKDEKLFSKNETSTITKITERTSSSQTLGARGETPETEIAIGDRHTIKLKDFHQYCLIGYATTIHKSQGDTCDGIVNIFNWKHGGMNGNLRYTAITRATALSNIRIINGFSDTYKEEYGCVYLGVCSKTGKYYVGSCRNFVSRVTAHKSDSNKCMSRHLVNPTFSIVAHYPSISKKQLLKMEQRYMNSVHCINYQKASI